MNSVHRVKQEGRQTERGMKVDRDRQASGLTDSDCQAHRQADRQRRQADRRQTVR